MQKNKLNIPKTWQKFKRLNKLKLSTEFTIKVTKKSNGCYIKKIFLSVSFVVAVGFWKVLYLCTNHKWLEKNNHPYHRKAINTLTDSQLRIRFFSASALKKCKLTVSEKDSLWIEANTDNLFDKTCYSTDPARHFFEAFS